MISARGRYAGSCLVVVLAAITASATWWHRCAVPSRPGVTVRAGRHWALVADAVAPGFFRPIEGGVGRCHQRVLVAVLAQAGHAERRGQVRQFHAHVGKHDGVAQALAQALGHHRGQFDAGVGQYSQHFLAAEAHGEVGWAQRIADQAGGGRQRHVADDVAVGIVELLEVVEVDHDDRQAAAGAGRARRQLRQHVIEPGAVVQARERVVERQLAVEFAQLLAPAQQRIGGADAEREQAQQIARQHARAVDQRPDDARFDHQELAVFQRRHGRQVRGIVQHGLVADAFAGQDAGGAGFVACVRVRFDFELAREYDIQVRLAAVVDALALRQAHDGAVGQHRGDVRVGFVAKQLQVVDMGTAGAEGADLFQVSPQAVRRVGMRDCMCYYISGIIADCATPARLAKLKPP